MKTFFKIMLFAIICTPATILQAQNAEKQGLYWGVQMGVYKAHNNIAQLYSGNNAIQTNLDKLLHQSYYYDSIAEYFNDDFRLYQYAKMNYNPGAKVGAFLHYYLSPHFGVFSRLSIMQLKSKGVFQIQLLHQPSASLLESNIKNGIIHSKEQRFVFDFGSNYKFATNGNVAPYIQGGVSLQLFRISEHEFKIGETSGIFMYADETDVAQDFSTFSFGPLLAAGIEVPYRKKHIQIGVEYNALKFTKINNKFLSHIGIMCMVEM